MKIKTKKQLNLPQLIEWGFENYVTGSIYSDDRVEAKKIRFEVGVIASMYGDMHKGDTFTVEAEEEITEDTVFEEMFLIINCGLGIETYSNYSINDVLSNNEGYYEESLMLIMKPEPTIIWTKDKGLVE